MEHRKVAVWSQQAMLAFACLPPFFVAACTPSASTSEANGPAPVASVAPAAPTDPASSDEHAAPAAVAAGSAEPSVAPEKGTQGGDVSASLDGPFLNLLYRGATHQLSDSSIHKVGTAVELHYQQRMDLGETQIWIIAQDPKPGKPAVVKGPGMYSVFVQLQDGNGNTRNVSSSCSASGSVTFEVIPTKKGEEGKGTVDVTIVCQGLTDWSGPLVIKGAFSRIPHI